MNTPKSDKHPGEKPRPDEKKRTHIATPIDEEPLHSTAEEERYTEAGTPPRDETYRPSERYVRGDDRYVDTTPPYHSDAARAVEDAGNTVKTGIASGLRGIDEIEADMVNLVRNTISHTLQATGAVGTEAVDVTRTTVNAAAQGIGEIGTTAVTSVRDILVSVVGGIKDVAIAAMPRSSYRTEDRIPPEDRTPPEYTPPSDRTRPPEHVPPAKYKEPV
ncbi:hypothetical protein SAMN05216412_103102 [Nitrosospira multiformis]|uniref:Uncharacterized protein n=1 Tax=Nitrosospira multiformis TaxID=1231 RepID=A0A1I0BPX2_9PROT|nr:hypothetical protein [Nitrosospira multiformis]SET08992.1 hypothetical protein SAMN05216412_103102 [Nitrosospira multiformis]